MVSRNAILRVVVFKNCVITTTLKNPTQHLIIPRGTDSVRDLIESCMIDCGQNHQKRSGLNIPYLVYIKHVTVYSSTGYSPYYLFFEREPILLIDLTFGLQKSTVDENLPLDDWI